MPALLVQSCCKHLSSVAMALTGQKRPHAGPQSRLKRQKVDLAAPTASSLPVRQVQTELVTQLRQHQVVVVVAETGSGKTTQVGGIEGAPL